ncbi:hypothetical protein [Flavobacterium psychrophilum]|nr:hypothetical protein [Flavobacterium psychrophilum]
MKTPKHLAILEAITTLLLANKKKHTLAGFLVLWVEKWLYP